MSLIPEQGAQVTAAYNSSSHALDRDAKLQQAQKDGQFQAIQGDVTDEHAVEALFDQAERGFDSVVKVLVGEQLISHH